MTIRSPKWFCSLAFAALALVYVPVAAPALAETPAAAPAPAIKLSTDTAKIALGEQIFSNLHIIELIAASARNEVVKSDRMAEFTNADKVELGQILYDEIMSERATLLHKLSASVVDPYTTVQLNNILTLSKMKFMQDSLWSAIDPSVVPDINSLTPEEQKFLSGVINEPYIGSFFDSLNGDVLTADVERIGTTAAQKFLAKRAAAAPPKS